MGIYIEITSELMDQYRRIWYWNSRKIGKSFENIYKFKINAMVIIGWDDSNINAVLLA